MALETCHICSCVASSGVFLSNSSLHTEMPGDGLCCAWMADAPLPGMPKSVALELCTEFVPD